MDDGCGQGLGLGGRNEDACLLVEDEFGTAIHSGSDDGQAGGHCFENGVGQAFPEGGEDEQLAEGEEVGDVLAGAEEVDVGGEVGLGELGLDLGTQFAIADEEKVGVGHGREDGGDGLQQVLMPFLGVEAGDVGDDHGCGGQP